MKTKLQIISSGSPTSDDLLTSFCKKPIARQVSRVSTRKDKRSDSISNFSNCIAIVLIILWQFFIKPTSSVHSILQKNAAEMFMLNKQSSESVTMSEIFTIRRVYNVH